MHIFDIVVDDKGHALKQLTMLGMALTSTSGRFETTEAGDNLYLHIKGIGMLPFTLTFTLVKK